MSGIVFIGCDPGAKGALCALLATPTEPMKIEFLDNSQGVHAINNWLCNIVRTHPVNKAMLEDVHSLPGMSAKSNFVFGYNLGEVKTILRLQPFGLDTVQPKEWQKFLGVKPKPKGVKRTPVQLKREVASLVEQLYPGCNIRGPKGGLLDGRSDALGIAHYCYCKYK